MKWLLTCVFLLFFVEGQTQKVNWRELSPDTGFPAVRVNCILQDSKGFIWFGAREGLIRYDGAHYKIFYPNQDDSTGLYQGNIHYLFEDSKGKLWLSAGKGIDKKVIVQVYDPYRDQFTLTDAQPVLNRVMTSSEHYARNYFLEDEYGNIWIKCYAEGLYKVEETTPGIYVTTHYKQDPEDTNYSSGDSIVTLFLDSKHQLWVGTKGGLYNFDRKKEKFIYNSMIENDQVTGIVEDRNGKLWVNYEKEGLLQIDQNKVIHKLKRSSHDAKWLYGINRRFMLLDRFDNIWMIHMDSVNEVDDGIDCYNITTGKYSQYFQLEDNLMGWYLFPFLDQKKRLWIFASWDLYYFNEQISTFELFSRGDTLLYNSVYAYIDRDENIWTDKTSGGAKVYHPSNQKFWLLSSKAVEGAVEDNDKKVWAAGYGGLVRYALADNNTYKIEEKVQVIKAPYCYEPILDSHGNIWVSCVMDWASPSAELFKIKASTGEIASFKNNPEDSSSITPQPAKLSELENDKFLIGTWGDGLGYFDPASGKSKHFYHNPDDTSSISSNIWVKVMIVEDEVWISHQRGLQLFNWKKEEFTEIDRTSIQRFGIVNDVIKDRDGNYWISGGHGLFQYEPKTQKIKKHYSIQNGLPSSTIMKIIEDEKGNLWFGSINGLVCFDKYQETFRIYNTSDGLPTNKIAPIVIESNSPSGNKRSNGSLMFGTQKGLIIFHPDSLPMNTQLPRTTITDFKLFNQPVEIGEGVLSTSISYTNKVVLNHNQNVLSLSYSALNFANPDKNQYAYYVEGVDQDWNYVGNETTARYAGLPPGEYTFKLKASNNDGLWNETPTTLAITILPPWWRTIWAYLLYTVVFLGALYTFYRVKVNRKLEMAEAHRLQELNTFKTRFYTNITHEFRTPLTVILGMTEQLDGQYHTVKNMIKRNAQNLLRLVNQLLDLSKLEAGMLTLQMQQGDIIPYIRYVVESFHSLAEHKNITVHYRSEVPQLVMDYDADKMLTVVSNLISNAIKFTPEDGHVSLIVSQIQDTSASRFRLSVMDTGMGIPADQLPHIFDRFYQVDNSTTREGEGTGVGLALTRELVTMLGGTINVKSTVWQGSEFTVELPITNTAPTVAGSEAAQPLLAWSEAEEADFSEVLILSEEKDRQPVALIVEDNMDVVYYLRTCLQGKYTFEVAQNGQQGIDKALEILPDIIISDVMMPEKNGYELCQTLKTNIKTSHIPIILLTAKAAEEDKLQGLTVGADAYLTKPFNQQELRLRLQNLIKARQRLWRQYRESYPYPIQELDVADPDQQFLTQAIEILEKHKSDSDFHVENLVRELGVSRTLLHVKLKALTGQSASQFIRNYRLQYAAQLLKQNFGNIAQVAYEAGFNDQSYFTKSFKKHFGMAPSEFVKSV